MKTKEKYYIETKLIESIFELNTFYDEHGLQAEDIINLYHQRNTSGYLIHILTYKVKYLS